MSVPPGRIATLAALWLACPCVAGELPSSLRSAARLSEQAASAASPSAAQDLAFQALQGDSAAAPDVRQTTPGTRRPDIHLRSPAFPTITPEPPVPAAAPVKAPGRRRVLSGAAGGVLGFLAGLLLGALLGAGLGLLDMGLRTKDMTKGRGAARAALALPAMVAGAVIGQLTFWAAGAKFMWDKGSKPSEETA